MHIYIYLSLSLHRHPEGSAVYIYIYMYVHMLTFLYIYHTYTMLYVLKNIAITSALPDGLGLKNERCWNSSRRSWAAQRHRLEADFALPQCCQAPGMLQQLQPGHLGSGTARHCWHWWFQTVSTQKINIEKVGRCCGLFVCSTPLSGTIYKISGTINKISGTIWKLKNYIWKTTLRLHDFHVLLEISRPLFKIWRMHWSWQT